ncbi:MAG: hypothetical protein SNG38_05955 [Rikenellaceae bacterium]
MNRAALLSILMLISVNKLIAQRVGVGYYDLDKFYDTIPSKFYNDLDYTPDGKYGWNQDRYFRKLEHTVAVIDSMALPIIGLYGVENESVVRDLVMRSDQDYAYVHRTRNSLDGMDFALLYYGDKLFIEEVEALRNMIIIKASLHDDTPIIIILSRNGGDTLEYLDQNSFDSLIVVLGNIYQREIDKMNFTHPLKAKESRGEGNYCSTRGWVMHDRIAINQSEKILKSGVFITPWLLNPSTQTPLSTFSGSNYIGGFGKYLPIFVYIN